jgi:hypothetical protein
MSLQKRKEEGRKKGKVEEWRESRERGRDKKIQSSSDLGLLDNEIFPSTTKSLTFITLWPSKCD